MSPFCVPGGWHKAVAFLKAAAFSGSHGFFRKAKKAKEKENENEKEKDKENEKEKEKENDKDKENANNKKNIKDK